MGFKPSHHWTRTGPHSANQSECHVSFHRERFFKGSLKSSYKTNEMTWRGLAQSAYNYSKFVVTSIIGQGQKTKNNN